MSLTYVKEHLKSFACVMALLMAGVAQTSHAATYYVRVSGDDTNSGTSAANAWKTVHHAMQNVTAGDTVYVGGGTYMEDKVDTHAAGTVTNPIRFIADRTGAMTGDGGIVLIKTSAPMVMEFEHNYNHMTGFVFDGGSPTVYANGETGIVLDQCTISNSTGSGIDFANANASVTNCEIVQSAQHGAHIRSNCTVTFSGCTFRNNGSDGIRSENLSSVLTIRKSRIHDNSGHGLYLDNCTATIVNCLIYKNLNEEGIQTGTSLITDIIIWHSTIVENSGDGIDQDGGALTIKNSIVAFNGAQGLRREAGTMTHTYNIVHGHSTNFYGTSQSAGELTSDPLFANMYSYMLTDTSPAINAGTNGSAFTNVDLIGKTRPVSGGWDMGCYEGPALFKDVSSSVGFDCQSTTGEDFGSGFHWADLNLDGFMDAIITGDSAKIAMNQSGTSFILSPFGGGNVRRQGAIADFDNDGDLDFWAVNIGSNTVEGWYENDGNGSFTLVGDAGFDNPSNNEGVAAADLNWDGVCDIVMFSENGNWIGMHDGELPVSFTGTVATVYGLNDSGDFGNGYYCSSGDVNNDGYPDFFYHYSGGRLFLSEGDGTYRRKDAPGNIVVDTGNTIKSGSAWGDYDNDGLLDVFVTHYDPDPAKAGYLFRQLTDGTFVDVNIGGEAGIKNPTGQRSACWGDYDNDGDLDLYVVTRSGGNHLYRNDGVGSFLRIYEGADVGGNNHDAAFVDYDNDGDLDLAVTRQGTTNIFLHNNLFERTGNANYLKIRVIGAGNGSTNPAGIGTRMAVYNSTGATLLARRDVGMARGYAGSEPLWLHVGGLNPATTYIVRTHFINGMREMVVTPNATSTTIASVVIPQMLTVYESPPDQRVVEWKEDDPLVP